jgi:TrmH family RNA methyltransferase
VAGSDAPMLRGGSGATVRWLRSLAKPRARQREGLAVVEGVKAVAELLPLADRVVRLFWSDAAAERPNGAALVEAFRERGVAVDRVAPELLERMADTRSPQGVIAVARLQPAPLERVLSPMGDLLVLEDVQDPGNVGTLIRTVEAAGGTGMVLAGACADPTGPKCVRAAAGSVFRVPFVLWPHDRNALAQRVRGAGYALGLPWPTCFRTARWPGCSGRRGPASRPTCAATAPSPRRSPWPPGWIP